MAPATSDARLRILESMQRQGAMTVDQLVEEFELSKTAMRAHLLQLEEQGLIERTTLGSDGPGRPPLAFWVTDRGSAIFPSDDAATLSRLLGYLEQTGESELVRAFFADIWQERLKEYERDLRNDAPNAPSLADRLVALESLLDRSNFMPEIEVGATHDGKSALVVIQECNCPLPAAVRATRIPCELESAFLARVIGVAPSQVSIARSRRERCRFEFELSRRAAAEDP